MAEESSLSSLIVEITDWGPTGRRSANFSHEDLNHLYDIPTMNK
jgi:hypothetical protein